MWSRSCHRATSVFDVDASRSVGKAVGLDILDLTLCHFAVIATCDPQHSWGEHGNKSMSKGILKEVV